MAISKLDLSNNSVQTLEDWAGITNLSIDAVNLLMANNDIASNTYVTSTFASNSHVNTEVASIRTLIANDIASKSYVNTFVNQSGFASNNYLDTFFIRKAAVTGTYASNTYVNDTFATKAAADVGPSALLDKIKTVDGVGSLLDADLLDGQHGSFYQTAVERRSSIDLGKMTGSAVGSVNLYTTAANTYVSSSFSRAIGNDGALTITNNGTGVVNIVSTGDLQKSGNKVMHTGNGGAGSLFDADRLDGQEGSFYTAIAARLGYTPVNKAGDTVTGALVVSGNLSTAANFTVTGTFTQTGNATFGGDVEITGLLTPKTDVRSTGTTTSVRKLNVGHESATNQGFQVEVSGTAHVTQPKRTILGNYRDGNYRQYVDFASGGNLNLYSINGNDAVTVNGFKIFHSGNGGTGSLFDADRLDGQEGIYYLNWNNLTNKPTSASAYGITDVFTKGEVTTALTAKANLASPVLTGTPTSPTASPGTNTLQLSTTAFVQEAVNTKATAITSAITVTTDSLQTQVNTKVSKAGDQMTGRMLTHTVSEKINSPAIASGVLTINLAEANVFYVTLNQNITSIVITGAPDHTINMTGIILRFIIGTANSTIAWPTNIKFPGGTAPAISNVVGQISNFTLFTSNVADKYLGFFAGNSPA